ncbi:MULTISPECIES: stage III sporulation protein AG [Bacillaceae]|uniref:Stage III sporulation protein AG n=1 Tax=Evansella alkalicola TaxID=745819 RepID=A0ABS6JZZ3_9BACI|nr:stage III sporulation protein AG [Litchfieldia alkalitelluris]MBU9724168.1 stage III sporulation protein AG [Bacillus alkalicola]
MGDKKDNGKEVQWFKSFDLKGKGSGKKINIKYLAVLLLLGVMFMMIGSQFRDTGEPSALPVIQDDVEEEEPVTEAFSDNKPKELSTMSDYESFYESQLERALEQVVGISDVSVVVNLAESEKTVFKSNENISEQFTNETDREGGTREVEDRTKDSQVVTIRNGDKEEPLIIKTEKPDIRGVLVVAKGVENIQVKSWVIEAVSRVLDLPSHRISVLPKKTEEES